MINFVLAQFAYAKINVINILPRANKGRNDIICALNEHIAYICDSNHRLNFIDTEMDFCLFCDRRNQRLSAFFRPPNARNGYDDVHLNEEGVMRLAKYLKYVAHKPTICSVNCEDY